MKEDKKHHLKSEIDRFSNEIINFLENSEEPNLIKLEVFHKIAEKVILHFKWDKPENMESAAMDYFSSRLDDHFDKIFKEIKVS